MVSPGLSYAATGRPQTHADLLPGKGAFLRLQGPQVYRFQSYYVDEKGKGQVRRWLAKLRGCGFLLVLLLLPETALLLV